MFVKIACVKIPGKGRGIVAREAFEQGELVERSPVIPIAEEDSERPGITDYAFAWGEELPACQKGTECAIAFGYLSLYNHSRSPNICLERHFDDNEMSVRTLRPIAPGEELTFDYDVPLWFDAVDH